MIDIVAIGNKYDVDADDADDDDDDNDDNALKIS